MMTSKISHNKIGAVYLSQKFYGEDKSKISPPLIQPRPAGQGPVMIIIMNFMMIKKLMIIIDDQKVDNNHDDQKVNDGEYKVAHES